MINWLRSNAFRAYSWASYALAGAGRTSTPVPHVRIRVARDNRTMRVPSENRRMKVSA